MTGAMAVSATLAAGGCAFALWAYALFRQERAERRGRPLSDRALYEVGKEAAIRRAARSKGRGGEGLPTCVRALAVVGGVAAAFSFATVTSGSVPVGVLAAVGVAAARGAWTRCAQGRRRALFDRQFARMLPQLAASVRSSLTVERALRVACARVDDPLRDELARVVADITYGTSLPDALEDMARRTGSDDVRALAAATRMQRKFGGSLAPVLDMVAGHVNARLKAARELETEVAGTRLAKWFVALSMPCIFFMMFAANADFARFYTEEPLGWVLAGVAIALEVIGLASCRAITSLDEPGKRRASAAKRAVGAGGGGEGPWPPLR
ncbi:hypothetical protein B5F40_01945 [Gordonibacter sp. An230]|uniref:type II secretion system F family protein n=1 Tax=Gordonibacter sp. An230 TaxID=1965592 RepID=UPI000B38937B|nr:type II secretion system F family protein [Gordonibacter sp. An230]OUO92116.1 hypothetical protein B5F40_01945 [Gordonibacter sp. An230]